MGNPRLLGLLHSALLLFFALALLTASGCGSGPDENGATESSAGLSVIASDAAGNTAETTDHGEVTVTVVTSTALSGSLTTATVDSIATSGAVSGPGSSSDTAPTSEETPSPGITPEEIKEAMSSLGVGSPNQLDVSDYGSFGHYAAAYAMAADGNMYLVLLNDETGGWAILATYTGLDWETVQTDLRAKAAPEDLIKWANPGEG